MTDENLNINLKHVKPSATLVINELSDRLINEGKEVYRLGFGQSPFPVPDHIVRALQDNAHQNYYLPVKGLLGLRMEIASYFNRTYNLSVSADDIIVGPGSKELIYIFQVAYAVDELLLPSPSWVSYEPQALLNAHKVIWLRTKESNDWKISAEDIARHCLTEPNKKRTLILNYPSNPLGVTYTKDELKALAKAFEHYQLTVISDEIYGELHHDGNHHTLSKFYPEGTIISSGLSKWAGAGGWRLGVFVFPKNLRYVLDAMSIVASETYTSASAPVQYAAVEAYKHNTSIEIYLGNSRKILKAVGIYVYEKLIQLGGTLPKPTGGFYLFPNFNRYKSNLNAHGIFTSKTFCEVLLEKTSVALLPGESFGHPKDCFTARLSYVDFDGKALLKILEQHPDMPLNDHFVEANCPKLKLAMEKMETWLLSI